MVVEKQKTSSGVAPAVQNGAVSAISERDLMQMANKVLAQSDELQRRIDAIFKRQRELNAEMMRLLRR